MPVKLPCRALARAGALRVHRPPYKFLDYYRGEDADIFCGRDTESQVVKRLILSHRLLTLFGPSGAGKTSLLLAGVLPQLAAEGYQRVYVRALDDPLPAMRKAIATRAGRDDWQAGDRLADFLPLMLAPKNRLIVVLDQFEELFLRVGGQKRGRFFQELAEAWTATSARCGWSSACARTTWHTWMRRGPSCPTCSATASAWPVGSLQCPHRDDRAGRAGRCAGGAGAGGCPGGQSR